MSFGKTLQFTLPYYSQELWKASEPTLETKSRQGEQKLLPE